MKKQSESIKINRFNFASKAVLWLIGAAILMALPAQGWSAGLLKSVAGQDDGISIRSHKVDVVINNGFSVTEVDQIFANNRDQEMEALYTFPLPKQASLSELSLWIDGNEVLGEVVEKKRARKIYEQQRDAGNQTALAEKNDYKTFDVSIGNVPAGTDVRVRLVYLQPIEIDLNIGRYLYPLAEGNVDDERIAFWSVDDQVDGSFQFNLKLKSAFPIKDVRVPGFAQEALIQQLTVDGESSSEYIYDVRIDKLEGATLAKDIICYYRLDDTVPARIEIIPYKASSADTGTFMAVVTPGADLQRIAEGTDWIFVLDVSGSMNGAKIASLTKGVSKVLGKMNPNDRFRVVTFNDGTSDVTSGFVTATQENVQTWMSRVQGLKSGGGTDLYSGLKEGLKLMDNDRTTGLILVTDGVTNVGTTAQAKFEKLVHEQDIRVFTFVIGNSANQPLLDAISKKSGGFAMNISDNDDITGRLLQAKAKVLHQSIYDVKLEFSGEKVHDLTPERYGNLYMGQQMVVFGRYNGSGKVAVRFSGEISGERKEWQATAMLPDVDVSNPELERIWALATIDEKMSSIRSKGEDKKLQNEIVALGVKFSLVTDYTSMVVVREEVFEGQGIQRNNAERVQKERVARQQRAQAPVKNHQVDKANQTFGGRKSSGIGSGPVGAIFVGALAWMSRRRNSR